MLLDVYSRAQSYRPSPSLLASLEAYISACLDIEKFTTDVEVSLSFVGQEEIRQLNRAYRGKNEPTDVLSFPAWDDFSQTLGDIVICIDIARKQAEEIGNSLDEEIIYLTVHSTFHLLGYDHMDEADKKLMRGKEKAALDLGGKYDRS